MTELRQQNVQNLVDTSISRRRYRDDEVPCAAVRKDPDGGLRCTVRGLALDSPKMFYGFDIVGEQALTGEWQDLNIDAIGFVNDDGTVFSLSGDELEILKTGDLEIQAKVTVQTPDVGQWGFEIVISENVGSGHVQDATTISNGGRGEAPGGIVAIVTKTGDYTATDNDTMILCDATAGAFTVTLPTAVGREGKPYIIKKIDATANVVTIDGNGAETIDKDETAPLASEDESITITSDNANWRIS